jgi:hypothetical protein
MHVNSQARVPTFLSFYFLEPKEQNSEKSKKRLSKKRFTEQSNLAHANAQAYPFLTVFSFLKDVKCLVQNGFSQQKKLLERILVDITKLKSKAFKQLFAVLICFL